jgi:hypothetical protein
MGDDGGMKELDMKDEASLLKGIPGISKVRTKAEKDGFIQRVSFGFKDVNALNQALAVLLKDSSGTAHAFFAWDGSTLVRTNNRFATEMGSDIGQDEEGSDSLDTGALLKSMHYKYDFKFATPVGEVVKADGVLREDPSPKEVKFDTDWSVIMNDPKALDLRINLPK